MSSLVEIVDELVAVMVTLGTNPQGTAGTVANRLGAQETPSALQSITAAGNTILANARNLRVSNTTGGSITLTSTPTIADGIDGQTITIFNVGTTQNIVLQNETVLAGSNMRLPGAANFTLGPRDSIVLQFVASLGEWITVTWSNNSP